MFSEESLLQKLGWLEETVSILKEQNEGYRILEENKTRRDTRKDYKDRLFKFIFGNPENKQWTLSLYNAMNGTDYADPDALQFNTIGDAVYMGMKNDISWMPVSP